MPAFQKIYKILSRRLRFFVQHVGATSLIDFNKLKKSKFFSKPTLFYFPSQKTMKTFCYSLIILAACLTSVSCAQPKMGSGGPQTTEMTPQIAWYGVLEDGLAEAKRTGRPILLISAACQCRGIPGSW